MIDFIITKRIEPGESEPGPGALRTLCSRCGFPVWVAPKTVADTDLRPPILCWQCAYIELGIMQVEEP